MLTTNTGVVGMPAASWWQDCLWSFRATALLGRQVNICGRGPARAARNAPCYFGAGAADYKALRVHGGSSLNCARARAPPHG